MLDFRILGPLEVVEQGRTLALGGAQQRALLALLLLHRREVISTDRLIDELWGERPPPTALKTVQVYVSHLRKALGTELVVTHGRGYLLAAEPDQVDLDRFEELAAEGRHALEAGDGDAASRRLREALALWRGPPLADFAYESFAQAEIGRLEEARLTALEDRIDADLGLGDHTPLVGELEALCREHPNRERLQRQLVLALYRSGRQADALERYRRVRQAMVDELGLEPGRELQELERSILAHDPALEAPAQPTRPERLAAQARVSTGAMLILVGGLILLAVATAVVIISGGGSQIHVAPNSIAVIDVKSHRLVDQVAVGQDPTDVSAAGRSLWVANTGDDTVTRIDERTRRVDATIAPGTAVDGMAAGVGAVWTSDNRGGLTARIDAALRRVDWSIRVGQRGTYYATSPVATAAGSVWVVKGASSVARIDPARRKVEAQIGVGNQPSGIAAGEGGVWVADSYDDTVTRIDPKTNGVITTIPVGPGASGIAAGDGGVWVADTLDDAVARIDPETNSVTTTVPVGSAPTGVALGAGGVWVANSGEGTVSWIDPQTNLVSATIDVGQSPQALAVADGTLWVSVQATPPPLGQAAAGGDGGTAQMVLSKGASYAPTFSETTDPALAGADSPAISYATGALLLNYPDHPFPAGARLQPEVARGTPEVSDGGKTYTYRLRRGFRFSPPGNRPVTAAAFQRAIERALDPRTKSYVAQQVIDDIVGLRAYQAHRASHIAGVIAHRYTLTIMLTAPSPSLPARLATQWFSAVPPNTPIDPNGIEGIPTAGPYYVASADPKGDLVLKRNPNYGGDRPARLGEIDITLPKEQAQGTQIADVEAGRIDALALNPEERGLARLRAQYGPQSDAVRAGQPRYFSHSWPGVTFLILNTRRPLFSSAPMRRAVNYAIDRPALARHPTPSSFGQPTDQYIPPGMRGFRDANVYPLEGPDVAKARRLADGRGHAVMWTCTHTSCRHNAEIVRANLKAIGIDVEIRQISDEKRFSKLARPRGGRWDIADGLWFADYSDPFDMLNVLFSPSVENSFDFGGFDDRRPEREMNAAARLSGARRYRAYARLDAELARSDPPVASYANPSNEYLFSARIGCEVDQPYYGVDFAAMCVRP